jgi:hypothetical protein
LSKAHAVGSESTIEVHDGDELWPLQPAPMSARSRSRQIHRDGDHGTHDEDQERTPGRGPHEIRDWLIAINPVP